MKVEKKNLNESRKEDMDELLNKMKGLNEKIEEEIKENKAMGN